MVESLDRSAGAGVDRAVRTVEHHHLPGPLNQWQALREEIHRDVCSRGFNTVKESFTQSYGSQNVDAALLLLPRVGFLPYTDPRIIGTIDVRSCAGEDGRSQQA